MSHNVIYIIYFLPDWSGVKFASTIIIDIAAVAENKWENSQMWIRPSAKMPEIIFSQTIGVQL